MPFSLQAAELIPQLFFGLTNNKAAFVASHELLVDKKETNIIFK